MLTWNKLLDLLTPQEKEVFHLVMTDRSYSSIAVQMGLHKREVAKIVQSATTKLLSAMRNDARIES